MSKQLILKTLVCQVTEDDTGSDEAYIKVNGEKVWGRCDMDNGYTRHILEKSTGRYMTVPVSNGVRIELFDYDPVSPDDKLGVWKTENPQVGDYVATFRGNWSFYTLFFSVEREGVPSELEIVKPSIGHPKICKPEELDNLRLTVATRSVMGDIDKAFFALQEGNIVLEDVETGQKLPCKLKDVNLWGLREQIFSNRTLYRQKRKELNEKPDRFPRGNAAFRAGCGIVTDFDVKIKPSVDIDEIAGENGWPRMFNLRLGESVSYHCIFVSETLSNKDELNFLHVTDTHVAHMYDIIKRHIKDCPIIDGSIRQHMLGDFRNPNDHLRAIIRYANRQEIDFMVITGDLVNWGSDGWFTVKPRANTNFRWFQQIITGADGQGEPLRCPLFLVPGNHEFYPFAIPLQFSVKAYGLEKFFNTTRKSELDRTNLEKYARSSFRRGRSTLRKMGDYYDTSMYEEPEIAATPAYVFLVNIYPHFFQYLMELSYEVSFTDRIGKHHLVLLNTGQDIGRPSKYDFIMNELSEKTWDYLQGGSQCQGFSGEDARILKNVMKKQDGQTGLVLVFTHAPLVNLEKNPDKDDKLEIVFEHGHEHAEPPNEITMFLYKLEPFLIYDSSTSHYRPPLPFEMVEIFGKRGYPQGGTRYFYCFPQGWSVGKRDELIDFACADGGSFKEVMQLITGTHPDIHQYCANVVVFSGHTHHVHEYRATGPQELDQEGPCIYAENYSGSEEWTKLPEGHKHDQLPQHQGDIAAWRIEYAPLFLISGALKGKEYPMFREVQVKGTGLNAGIQSMQMKQIKRWENLQPMYGLEYLYATESVSTELIARAFSRVWSNPEDIVDKSINACEYPFQVVWGGQDSFGRDRAMLDLMGKYAAEIDRLHITPGRHRRLRNLTQSIQDQFDRLLFRLAGYFITDSDRPYPAWYEPNTRKYGDHAAALLYAGISVRLNRFGIDFGSSARNSLELQGHYEWALNAISAYEIGTIEIEIENRIRRLFEAAQQGNNYLLCMWYASESSYLAEAGGYNIPERNDRDPSVHLNWALSMLPEIVIMDLIVKYQLQAERQFMQFGLETLKSFYSLCAARLASWGTKCWDKEQGDSVVPSYYKNLCDGWSEQRIMEDLSYRVNQVGQVLTPKYPWISIRSYNYPHHFIRHRNFFGEITRINSSLDEKDATFKIAPGLADSRYISFVSLNYPGYYLRHQNFRIKLHKKTDDTLFKKDVTFKIVSGLAESSSVSFESCNYPGYFIRHRNYHLYIEKGNTDIFRKDATFKLVEV